VPTVTYPHEFPYRQSLAGGAFPILPRALYRKPRGGKRLSFDAIAAALKAEGRPSRTGKAWVGVTAGFETSGLLIENGGD
jgi:hypothetical protein